MNNNNNNKKPGMGNQRPGESRDTGRPTGNNRPDDRKPGTPSGSYRPDIRSNNPGNEKKKGDHCSSCGNHKSKCTC